MAETVVAETAVTARRQRWWQQRRRGNRDGISGDSISGGGEERDRGVRELSIANRRRCELYVADKQHQFKQASCDFRAEETYPLYRVQL